MPRRLVFVLAFVPLLYPVACFMAGRDTFGKRILGLHVVRDHEGARLRGWRVAVRYGMELTLPIVGLALLLIVSLALPGTVAATIGAGPLLFWAYVWAVLILFLGLPVAYGMELVVMGATPSRRALHDYIAGTRVVCMKHAFH